MSLICTNTNVTGPKSQMNTTKQFNCLTYNVVYVMPCTKYAQLYVGETGRTLDTLQTSSTGETIKPAADYFN